jgi:acetyl esterase/lipase
MVTYPRLWPLRWTLPIFQLSVCLLALWPMRGFLIFEMSRAIEGRRRPQRRDCWRRLPQGHGLRQSQNNRHLRRILRRLHDADAIGKTPDIWAAAVDEYGIINWSTMLKSSDPSLNEYLKALLGNPEESRKVYEDDSPITYIRSEKAPLLVLQGDNDPRVPKEEAQQVVDILKKEGRVVDVHYYPNEGHGFVKRDNQIDSIRRTIAWFDQYLMGKNPAP